MKSLQLPLGKQLLPLLILTFLVILLSSCKKDDPIDFTTEYDIYTAGQYYDNGWKVCYWKGSDRVDINGDLISATVQSMYVYNNDVYIAGHYNLGSLIEKACYWKNTERFELEGDGIHQTYTSSIFVSDGNVYTAGRYYNGYKNIPCYWENSTRYDIVDYPEGRSATISGIFVVNSDVYLCGSYSVPSDFGPDTHMNCYWKNGEKTDLAFPEFNMTSMYNYDGELYFGGYIESKVDGLPIDAPAYIFNGEKNLLGNSGIVNSVFVTDGIVYSAGGDGSKPCYWKGSSKVVLNGVYRANSIFVIDSKVFTAGYYINESNSERPHFPCYWVGSNRYSLPVTGDYEDSHANNAVSIFVVKKSEI